jgi:hypothetical protein
LLQERLHVWPVHPEGEGGDGGVVIRGNGVEGVAGTHEVGEDAFEGVGIWPEGGEGGKGGLGGEVARGNAGGAALGIGEEASGVGRGVGLGMGGEDRPEGWGGGWRVLGDHLYGEYTDRKGGVKGFVWIF